MQLKTHKKVTKTYHILFVGKHQYDTIEHKWIIYDRLQVIHESIQSLTKMTYKDNYESEIHFIT